MNHHPRRKVMLKHSERKHTYCPLFPDVLSLSGLDWIQAQIFFCLCWLLRVIVLPHKRPKLNCGRINSTNYHDWWLLHYESAGTLRVNDEIPSFSSIDKLSWEIDAYEIMNDINWMCADDIIHCQIAFMCGKSPILHFFQVRKIVQNERQRLIERMSI